jgi:3-oxoadipate enol-lactonase
MPHAFVNGQRIYFEDSGGEGPPVILAHGFLMDQEMFAPQVAALAPEFRVITWDERGFGRTEFDGKPFSYYDSADDCMALLDHLGIDHAVVGGMSQGGFLSLRAALTNASRVTALLLFDTQAGVEDAETLAGFQQMLDMWVSAGPVDDLANAIATLILNDPVENERWIAKWRTRPKELLAEPGRCLLTRDDITDRLGHIVCPALVVHGTDDGAITMDRAEELAAGLGDCRNLVRIEGAAHAANLTHAAQVNPPVLEFLRKVA